MKTITPRQRLTPEPEHSACRAVRRFGCQHSGVTMIELIIVLEVILILISLTYPNLLVTRRAANEAAAIATLRAINTAETTYRTHLTRYGAMADLTTAHLLAPDVGAATSPYTSRADYYYSISPVANGATQYFSVALPDSTVATRVFYADETGVIWTAVIGTTIPSTDLSGASPGVSWDEIGQ